MFVNRWLGGCVLLIVLTPGVGSAAVFATLNPSYDVSINPVETPTSSGQNGDLANTNLGNDLIVDNATLRIGNSSASLGPDYRSFLKFDLSSAPRPTHAPVTASLRFYMEDLGSEDRFGAAQVRRINSTDWTPGSVTYAHASEAQSTSIGTFAPGTDPAPNQYYSVNVTSTVQGWLDGSFDNYGFAVKQSNEGFTRTARQLTSSTGAVSQRPELVLSQQTVWTPTLDVYVAPNAVPASPGQSGDIYNALDGTGDDSRVDNTTLRVGRNITSAEGDYRSFLKFDLTNVTRSDVILDAKLRIYLDDAQTFGGVQVHRVTSNWNAGTILYSQPISTLLGSFAGGPPAPATDGWYEIDLTNLVKDWVDTPGQNFGIRLIGTEGFTNTYREFSSSTGAFGPQLVLNFAAIPEPSTVLLAGLGILGLAVAARRQKKMSAKPPSRNARNLS